MKLVIIESPLGTNADGSRCTPEQFEKNQRYVEACMLDSLRKGETPFASHAIYPLVLKDADPEERKLGMEAGFRIAKAFSYAKRWSDDQGPYIEDKVRVKVAVYTDRGISSVVMTGLEKHSRLGIEVEFRQLGGDWSL